MKLQEQTEQAPWRLIIIGLSVGLFSSLLGIGGGILLVPLLTLWLGVERQNAVIISLFMICCFSFTGVVTELFYYPENVWFHYGLLLVLGSFLGVSFGLTFATKLPEPLFFMGFLGIIVLTIIKLGLKLSENIGLTFTWQNAALFSLPVSQGGMEALLQAPFALCSLIILGALGGILAGFFGLGGGIVYVPGLVLLFLHFSEHLQMARGTSLFAVFITSLYANLLKMKSLRKVLKESRIGIMLLAGVVGALLGVLFANFISATFLRCIFLVFLSFCIVKIFKSTRRGLPAAQKDNT